MPTLRLRQTSIGEDRYRVEIELEGQTAVSEFTFALSAQEQEDLRWHLEDFLAYPLDPAPRIAARIEGDMARIGEELFAEVFRTDDARDPWATLRAQLDDTLRIGDGPGAAVTAINLDNAYLALPAARDLDQAERWYRRSLELTPEGDRLGQARCHGQLGYVAWERFRETRSPAHLTAALREYLTALDLPPSSEVKDLAVAHNQLGNIYVGAGYIGRALHHYREAIR